ncbi:MAG: PQQ-binding-like beta-propeller repeat protein [Candidatus Riflebacteria bacterium]|nr:PQQ-binding-like beta-propeller repeat protein [Candidatus Riflebacteria bacterium]
MSTRLFGFLLVIVGMTLTFLLSRPLLTPELRFMSMGGSILSQPAFAGFAAVFVQNETLLSRVEANGVVVEGASLSCALAHPLLAIGSDIIVAVDTTGAVKAYASDVRTLRWERSTTPGGGITPLVFPENRLLLSAASAPDTLELLDVTTGVPIWASRLPGKPLRAVGDGCIACVHTDADGKSPALHLSVLEASSGRLLWTFPEAVDDRQPFISATHLAFCSAEGCPIAVDPVSGKETYRHPTGGMRVGALLDSQLLLLGGGGARIECRTIPDSAGNTSGGSWSSTMSSAISGLIHRGPFLFVIDGTSIYCLRHDDGTQIWKRDLVSPSTAFALSAGIAVVYKEGFLSRDTYMTLFAPETGNRLWTVTDDPTFWAPISLPGEDLVFSSSGHIHVISAPLTEVR